MDNHSQGHRQPVRLVSVPFTDPLERYSHNRADRKALVALRRAHPGEYEDIYRAEREVIEAEVREHGHPQFGTVGPKGSKPSRKPAPAPVETPPVTEPEVEGALALDEAVESPVNVSAVATHPETRTCAGAGCTVVLSRYNDADLCGLCTSKAHQQAVQAAFLAKQQVQADLKANRPAPVKATVEEPAPEPKKKTERTEEQKAAQREKAAATRQLTSKIKRMSDGQTFDLTIKEGPKRDAQGRIVCRGCDEYISTHLACGCDPGFLDDNAVPLDPRYVHLGPIADAVTVG